MRPLVSLEHGQYPVLETKNWDATLTPSRTNPYPLAPPDIVEAGEVNDDSYTAENMRLSIAAENVMRPELTHIAGEPGFVGPDAPCGLEILGAGLLRDIECWLPHAVRLGFHPVCVTDSSIVACGNVENFIEKSNLVSISPCHMDVETAWREGAIQDENTLVYYGGQFIQNQKQRAKDRMMKHFGRFIKMPTPDGCFRRRVYLLHARGEDNPPDRVRWRNTIPWMDEELRTPLERGFGGPALMEVIATHWYWHQLYSFFRISAPAAD